jgi:hypothetical protein
MISFKEEREDCQERKNRTYSRPPSVAEWLFLKE